MRRVRTGRWWAGGAMMLAATLLSVGCAFGASGPMALLAAALLLGGAATSLGTGCDSRAIGGEDDGGVQTDARPRPDASTTACGEGVCAESMACEIQPNGDPWCYPDADNDGVPDAADNCPWAVNPDQTDGDGDGMGDACDLCEGPNDVGECGEACCNDADGDGIPGTGEPGLYFGGDDNCPWVYNPDQTDTDGDFVGDACDLWPDTPNPISPCGDPGLDSDGDGITDGSTCGVDEWDPCPLSPSTREDDYDGDGTPDVCDPDGVPPQQHALAPPTPSARTLRRRQLLRRFTAAGMLDAETARIAAA